MPPSHDRATCGASFVAHRDSQHQARGASASLRCRLTLSTPLFVAAPEILFRRNLPVVRARCRSVALT